LPTNIINNFYIGAFQRSWRTLPLR